MPAQEQAFRAYYAAMSDADLLATAANKESFVEVAQRMLSAELARRNLALPAGASAQPVASGQHGPLHRLIHALRRTPTT